MVQPTRRPFVVGAYASMPSDTHGQRDYYDILADTGWVTGIEVPYPGQLAEPVTQRWLGEILASHSFTDSMVTAIPGTMVNVWKSPTFGLASPDADGRRHAFEFTENIRRAVAAINEKFGLVIRRVELHSAPTKLREAAVFADSLATLKEWDFGGAQIVIEHCDAFTPEHDPEKGFLSLDEEIAIATQVGVPLSINWGRVAVEARDGAAPTAAIAQALDAGVLSGLVFSGASPETTPYGGPWADGHLPLSSDEPSSLMTPQAVAEAVALVDRSETDVVLGAKCCVPKDAPLAERLAMITRIAAAAGIA